jgi:hypothetical protein
MSSLGGNYAQTSLDVNFMKDICLCISSVAAVEIPHGLWPEFISVMAQQANQIDNRFFRYAGIYNLGLVMEILEPQDFQ